MPIDCIPVAPVVYWRGFSSAAPVVMPSWRFNLVTRGTEPHGGNGALAGIALPILFRVLSCWRLRHGEQRWCRHTTGAWC